MAWKSLPFFGRSRKDIPGGLWMRCEGCESLIYRKAVAEAYNVCPECSYHFTISSRERIALLLDEGTFQEKYNNLFSCDPLEFTGVKPYVEKLAEAKKDTGLPDAVLCGTGRLRGRRLMICVTDSRFLMGSMGSVLGEIITRAAEDALSEKLPLIIVSGSGGGARMYEGALSLMQMAKTAAAINRYRSAGGLYISVLTNPTMAGVLASFASLGDVIIAEPKALIGFTGPRVIKMTINAELPPGFQTSEFLLEHGFIDRLVARSRLKGEIARLLSYLTAFGEEFEEETAIREVSEVVEPESAANEEIVLESGEGDINSIRE